MFEMLCDFNDVWNVCWFDFDVLFLTCIFKFQSIQQIDLCAWFCNCESPSTKFFDNVCITKLKIKSNRMIWIAKQNKSRLIVVLFKKQNSPFNILMSNNIFRPIELFRSKYQLLLLNIRKMCVTIKCFDCNQRVKNYSWKSAH